jgi:hypothetical protein
LRLTSFATRCAMIPISRAARGRSG